jgi:hypothetical protein
MTETYESTRRSLHGAAELLLAGPRYDAGGSIQLRAGAGGITTWDAPAVTVHAGQLVLGSRRVDLDGLTFAEAGSRVGLTARRLDDVYRDGPGLSVDDVISVDLAQADVLEEALARGDQALRAFAPSEEPILWPEHFDVGVTLDQVDYGVSPGDAFHPRPYAYVGPHRPQTGPFWNAPFGASRSLQELTDASAVVAFFEEGRTTHRIDE